MILWDTYFESAQQALSNGSVEKALELFVSALEEVESDQVRDERWLRTILGLSQCHLRLRQWDEAQKVLAVEPEPLAACPANLRLDLFERRLELGLATSQEATLGPIWQEWLQTAEQVSPSNERRLILKRLLSLAPSAPAWELERQWSAQLLGSDHPEHLQVVGQLIEYYFERQQWAQAEPLLRERAHDGPTKSLLAKLLRAQGKLDEAVALHLELLQDGILGPEEGIEVLRWACALSEGEAARLYAVDYLAREERPSQDHLALLQDLLDRVGTEDQLRLMQVRIRWCEALGLPTLQQLQWIYLLALALEEAGQAEDAFFWWQRILLEGQPEAAVPEAHLRSARRARKAGDSPCQHYRAALMGRLERSEWHENWFEDALHWAEAEFAEGHGVTAKAVVEPLMNQYEKRGRLREPNYARALLLFGRLLLSQQQFSGAVRILAEAQRSGAPEVALEAAAALVELSIKQRDLALYEEWSPRLAACGLEPPPFERAFDLAEAEALLRSAQWSELEEELRRFHEKLTLEEPAELQETRLWLAECLEQQGRWDEALHQREQSLEMLRQSLGNEHALCLRAQMQLGQCYNALSRFVEGEKILAASVRLYEKVHGADSLEVGRILLALAESFRLLGKDNLMEAVSGRAVGLLEKHLPVGHPERLQAKRDLVQWLMDQGRFKEARTQLEQMEQEESQAFGKEHPELAVTLSQWAGLETAEGNYPAAENHYRRSLEMFQRGLGDSHPNVAATLNNLGQNLYRQAKYAQAASMLQRALAVFDPYDAGRVSTMVNLGLVFQAQQDFPEAEKWIRQAWQLSREWLGEEDLEVAFCCFTLAQVLEAQGQLESALDMAQQALNIRERRLGALHPETATSQTQVSQLLLAAGRGGDAIAVVEGSLNIQIQALGGEHPELAPTYASLGRLHLQQKNWDKAEEALFSAVHLVDRTTSYVSAELAELVAELGCLRAAQGELQQALGYSARATELLVEALGPNHEKVDIVLLRMARLYREHGSFKECETCLKRVLEQRTQRHGPEHPTVAQCWLEIAALQQSQGRAVPAETLGKKALELFRSCTPASPGDLRAALEFLLQLADSLGQTEVADNYRQQLSLIAPPEEAYAKPTPAFISQPVPFPETEGPRSATGGPSTPEVVTNQLVSEAVAKESSSEESPPALPDVRPEEQITAAEPTAEVASLQPLSGEVTTETPAPQPEMPSTVELEPPATEPEAAVEAPPLIEPEVAVEVAPQLETEPAVEVAPQLETEPAVEVAPQLETEPAVEVAPQLETEPAVEVAPQLEPEAAVEVAPQLETEPAVESPPQSEPEAAVEVAPPIEPEAEPEVPAEPEAPALPSLEQAMLEGNWVYAQELLSAKASECKGGELIDVLRQWARVERQLARQGEAEKLLSRALRLGVELYGDSHPELVAILGDVAEVSFELGRAEQAEGMLRKATEIHVRQHSQDAAAMVFWMKRLGEIYLPHKSSQALAPLQRAVGLVESKMSGQVDLHSQLLESLARAQMASGEEAEAIVSLRKRLLLANAAEAVEASLLLAQLLFGRQEVEAATQLLQKLEVHMPVPPALIEEQVKALLGHIYLQTQRPEEAEPRLLEALQLRTQRTSTQDKELLPLLMDLAALYWEREADAQVLIFAQQALALLPEDAFEKRLVVLSQLAPTLKRLERKPEAETYYRQWLELVKQSQGANHLSQLTPLDALARLCQENGDGAAAQEFREAAWHILSVNPQVGEAELLAPLEELARGAMEQTQWDKAESWLRRGYALAEKFDGSAASRLAYALGEVFLTTGRLSEAENALRRSHEFRQTSLGVEHPDTLKSLHRLAEVYSAQGRSDAAQSMLIRCLEAGKANLGEEHPDMAGFHRALGELWMRTGRLQEAEASLKKALSLVEKVVPVHPELVAALETLGRYYQQIDQLAQAAPFYGRALDSMEQQLGPSHLGVADSLLTFGEVQVRLGHLAEAEKLYRRCLEIRQAKLPAQHPRLAQVRQSLASLLQRQGQTGPARELFEQALATLSHEGAPESVAVAECLEGLAMLELADGNASESESRLTRALAIRELDSEHLAGSLVTHQLLARVYLQGRRYDVAEKSLKRALELAQKSFGADRPEVAACLEQLGNLHLSQGRYVSSEALFDRALEIRERSQSSEHPDCAFCLLGLAQIYLAQNQLTQAWQAATTAQRAYEGLPAQPNLELTQALYLMAETLRLQGRHKEAEGQYQRALELRTKLLGNDHVEVQKGLHGLATCLFEQNKLPQAERIFTHALRILETKLGAEHPELAQPLHSLGLLHRAQGRGASAELHLKRALELRVKGLGADHPDLAGSYQAMAQLNLDQRNDEAAETLLKQAIAIREKALRADHPALAQLLILLAGLYKSQERFGDAEPRLKKVLDQREKQLGTHHPDTALILQELGELYLLSKQMSQAETFLRRALDIFEKRLGEEHPSVLPCLHLLWKVYDSQNRPQEAGALRSRIQLLEVNRPNS